MGSRERRLQNKIYFVHIEIKLFKVFDEVNMFITGIRFKHLRKKLLGVSVRWIDKQINHASNKINKLKKKNQLIV